MLGHWLVHPAFSSRYKMALISPALLCILGSGRIVKGEMTVVRKPESHSGVELISTYSSVITKVSCGHLLVEQVQSNACFNASGLFLILRKLACHFHQNHMILSEYEYLQQIYETA